jgi:Dyp-type peroxidase family
LTPRYLAASAPHARLFGKPGQPLLWPGQILLGEPRQDTQDLYKPAAAAKNFPAWARRGSYLVCRRLRQDVPAFWQFVIDHAGALEPVAFAAQLVGRWPSGAPLARGGDDPALAGDEFANNHFLFEDPTRPSGLAPLAGYAGDGYPAANPGACPAFAHIRKVNPRDGGTDFGTPADTLLRLMLRRGIPFGPPLAGVADPAPALVRRERGLMFIGFAATIEDQFEFVMRRWVNSGLHPRFGGHDPLIGRSARGRFIDHPSGRIALDAEWVRPTGGGYFFAPPVSAVADVLGA